MPRGRPPKPKESEARGDTGKRLRPGRPRCAAPREYSPRMRRGGRRERAGPGAAGRGRPAGPRPGSGRGPPPPRPAAVPAAAAARLAAAGRGRNDTGAARRPLRRAGPTFLGRAGGGGGAGGEVRAAAALRPPPRRPLPRPLRRPPPCVLRPPARPPAGSRPPRPVRPPGPASPAAGGLPEGGALPGAGLGRSGRAGVSGAPRGTGGRAAGPSPQAGRGEAPGSAWSPRTSEWRSRRGPAGEAREGSGEGPGRARGARAPGVGGGVPGAETGAPRRWQRRLRGGRGRPLTQRGDPGPLPGSGRRAQGAACGPCAALRAEKGPQRERRIGAGLAAWSRRAARTSEWRDPRGRPRGGHAATEASASHGNCGGRGALAGLCGPRGTAGREPRVGCGPRRVLRAALCSRWPRPVQPFMAEESRCGASRRPAGKAPPPEAGHSPRPCQLPTRPQCPPGFVPP